MIINFDQENLLDIIDEETTIIDFFADWCGPCKMQGVVLEDLVKKEKIKVIKVNTDLYENIAKEYGIMTIPTLLLFKEHKLVGKKVGLQPIEELTDWTRENF